MRRSILNALITIVLMLMATVGCKNPKSVDIDKSIASHFNDVNYKVIKLTDEKISKASALSIAKGKGVFSINGKNEDYKWAFIFDKDDNPISVYIGAKIVTKNSAAQLSESETRDALRRCSQTYPDLRDMFDCMDRVMGQYETDCDLSFTPEDCAENCWLNPRACLDRL